MKIRGAAVSVHGRRAVNEDNFFLDGRIKEQQEANDIIPDLHSDDREGILFAVCDGLGGEGNGEMASFCAVNLLKSYSHSFDKDYMDYLNRTNIRLAKLQQSYHNAMDSTFAGLFLRNGSAMILNLGDSRVYRMHEGHLEQLSCDHSEFAVMLKYGVVKEEDYYSSSMRSHLTRTLGQRYPDDRIEPSIIQIDRITPGDQFLLCSDGLCGYLKDDEIRTVMEHAEGSEAECCRDLAAEAFAHESDDNITAMIVRTG